MARGGKRQPRNPAPVAGPAHQSERTDTGRPKLSEAGGRPYGERQDLAAQEQTIQPPVPAPGAGSAGPAGPIQQQPASALDPFRPTERPTQSILSGTVGAGGEGPQLSADEVLRILYRIRPSPWIARMLTDGA